MCLWPVSTRPDRRGQAGRFSAVLVGITNLTHLVPYAHTGDPGSFSQCLHPGNGPNGTHFALEELSGNLLGRAESGAHEAQRDAASGHPFSCERPATFRARLPRGAAAGVVGCEFVRAKAGYRTEAPARGPRAGPGPRPDGGR